MDRITHLEARLAVEDAPPLLDVSGSRHVSPEAPPGNGGGVAFGGDMDTELRRLQQLTEVQQPQLEDLSSQLEAAAGSAALVDADLREVTNVGTYLWLEFMSPPASKLPNGSMLADHAQTVLGIEDYVHPSVAAARGELANTPLPFRAGLQRSRATRDGEWTSGGGPSGVCHICGESGHLAATWPPRGSPIGCRGLQG